MPWPQWSQIKKCISSYITTLSAPQSNYMSPILSTLDTKRPLIKRGAEERGKESLPTDSFHHSISMLVWPTQHGSEMNISSPTNHGSEVNIFSPTNHGSEVNIFLPTKQDSEMNISSPTKHGSEVNIFFTHKAGFRNKFSPTKHDSEMNIFSPAPHIPTELGVSAGPSVCCGCATLRDGLAASPLPRCSAGGRVETIPSGKGDAVPDKGSSGASPRSTAWGPK